MNRITHITGEITASYVHIFWLISVQLFLMSINLYTKKGHILKKIGFMSSLNKIIIPVKTSVCVNRHEICVMQSKLIDENKQKHM